MLTKWVTTLFLSEVNTAIKDITAVRKCTTSLNLNHHQALAVPVTTVFVITRDALWIDITSGATHASFCSVVALHAFASYTRALSVVFNARDFVTP